MNIILLGQHRGMPRSISLGTITPWLVGLLGLTVLVNAGVFYAGYLAASVPKAAPMPAVQSSEQSIVSADVMNALSEQQAVVAAARSEVSAELDAMGARIGKVQAQLVRLDALGGRLVDLANLDAGEFDFKGEPPMGGAAPQVSEQDAVSPDDLTGALAQLDSQLRQRELQLQILESMLVAEDLRGELVPSGRPIKGGWMSSRFGKRHDPVTGKRSFHRGVDFAGRRGSDVFAVAAGVVTFSGKKSGYGNLVEIDHGDGFSTRYGHNKSNKVQIGDVVTRGQVIALLGSTGRSTGPHVHFEVLKEGRTINPIKFIRSAKAD